MLGGSLGFAQDFRGPLAKPHRMFALTLGCLLAAAEAGLWGSQYALVLALALIAAGSAVTCATRTRAISQALRARRPMNLASQVLVGLMKALVGAHPRWQGVNRRPRSEFILRTIRATSIRLRYGPRCRPKDRATTRPVAAKDYWNKGALRRYVAIKGLNAVLIERAREDRTGDPCSRCSRRSNKASH